MSAITIKNLSGGGGWRRLRIRLFNWIVKGAYSVANKTLIPSNFALS